MTFSAQIALIDVGLCSGDAACNMVRAQPIYFYTRVRSLRSLHQQSLINCPSSQKILPLFLALSPATHMARLTDLAFIQRDNPSSYGQTVLPWLSDRFQLQFIRRYALFPNRLLLPYLPSPGSPYGTRTHVRPLSTIDL